MVGPKAVPALIQALKDEREWVRQFSAEALGNIGPKAEQAVPALIQALKDKDKLVRANAAWALGKIGLKDEKSLNALRVCLEAIISL